MSNEVSADNAAAAGDATGGGDDFIPAPADGGAQSAPAATENTTIQPDSNEPIGPLIQVGGGVGQTGLILAAAAVIAFGGLLLLLRNAIRKSLIAARAPLDAANTASWVWYFALLAVITLIIIGVTTGLLMTGIFMGAILVVAVIGCSLALMMSSRAKRG